MTIQEKLQRLHNRGTAWEIIALDESRKVLVGYSARKSRQGLFSAIRSNGPAIIRAFGLSDDAQMTAEKSAGCGFTFTIGCAAHGSITLQFSGRTHRQAICEGELPWVESSDV